MMHVRFNEAWHGKVHKQPYKLSGAQYATPSHIDETPRDLFSSILFMYPAILNVVKHGKRVKHNKTTQSKQFKWGRNITNNKSGKSPCAYFGYGTLLPYTQF